MSQDTGNDLHLLFQGEGTQTACTCGKSFGLSTLAAQHQTLMNSVVLERERRRQEQVNDLATADPFDFVEPCEPRMIDYMRTVRLDVLALIASSDETLAYIFLKSDKKLANEFMDSSLRAKRAIKESTEGWEQKLYLLKAEGTT